MGRDRFVRASAPLAVLAVALCSPAKADDAGWSYSASLYTYFLHDESDYSQPTLTADRGWFHGEARYNYEAQETGSVWVGYNFAWGDDVTWEVTPIGGVVFGDLDGWGSGLEAALTWKALEVYTENEFIVDRGASSDSFFYSWSEVSLAATEWLRFGGAGQRTRAREDDREVEPGAFARCIWGQFQAAGYAFFPGEGSPVFVAQVAFRF